MKSRVRVHPQALESLRRYREDLKAGHKGGAEYWRGAAAGYFTANPPIVIPFNRTMRITNLDQLARGTGAKYLEVIESHLPGEYIAVRWRRKIAMFGLPEGHIHLRMKNPFWSDLGISATSGLGLGAGWGVASNLVSKVFGKGKNPTRNVTPRKTSGVRIIAGKRFYYVGRTLYSSKAYTVAREIRDKGLGAAVTKRRDQGYLIWATKPVYVDLSEQYSVTYHNPVSHFHYGAGHKIRTHRHFGGRVFHEHDVYSGYGQTQSTLRENEKAVPKRRVRYYGRSDSSAQIPETAMNPIPKSTLYKVTQNGLVVFAGNKKEAIKFRKKYGGKLWLSPSTKVGDRLENPILPEDFPMFRVLRKNKK